MMSLAGSPMSKNTTKERLSLAYIQAVAARAGYELLETKVDIDSVDGHLICTIGKRPRIEFQAKATAQNLWSGDSIAFPLSKKNYDDLRAETVVPRILVVFWMPDDETQWLSHGTDQLTVRHCGYWLSLQGAPDRKDVETITVHVPRGQVFNETQLRDLMSKAEAGPLL